MNPVMLTKEERERFAAWLDQEATTNTGLLEQMAKINVSEAIMKERRVETLAMRVVSKVLKSIHDA